MALTNAERQKIYRERMRTQNHEKYEELKRKNAERNKKRKNIKECSEKVKEFKRTQWRVSQKRHREKIKDNKKIGEKKEDSNPHEDNNAEMCNEIKVLKRRCAYQKMKYEEKSRKMTTEIKSLKKKCKRYMQKIKKLIKLVDDLKLRNSELEETITSQPNVTIQDMTPLSKSNSFIEENLRDISEEQKEKVKKQLLTHNVLVTAIQETYTETKKNEERNILKRILDKDVVKKYKTKSEITKSVLGLKGRVRQRRQLIKKNNSIINEIINFYNRDDVSRATAGRKEFKTKGKIKKQKRYLLNSLKELYKKYREEGGRAKKSSFQKYKPFYIVAPKLSDRETCGCIKHENFLIKVRKLYSLKLIRSTDIYELISEVVCDIKNKICAYGECYQCKNNNFKFDTSNLHMGRSVTWEEFSLQSHEYINKKDGKKTTIRKMEKKEIKGNIESLVESFNIELKMMRKHVFNIRHQYSQYSLCIENLKPTEAAIHVDFSENYVCKLATEVQSMHFGASKSQITIHTGVLYAKDNKPLSFASLSPSHEHGPEAIWAHLNPILNYIKEKFPLVNAVHFFSDGPSTQYKQKKNFFLFLKFTKIMGFPYSTWNFSESAHEKGAPDGVGGGLKRRLDDFVKHGTDVPDAYTAYKLLKNSDTSVMIFYIPEADISKHIIEDLTPVPKTMDIHQITNTETTNCLRFRCLSCFCGDAYRGYCECYDVKNHQLVKVTDYKVETKNTNLKRKITKYSETNRQQNKKQKKVTILSEVRFTAENMAYDNLLNYRPINLQKMRKLDKDFDLSIETYKENIDFDNPKPSTSGICQQKEKKPSTAKEKRYLSTINPCDSTSDEDDTYSLHDSSEGDFYEDLLSDTEGLEDILNETEMKEKINQTEIENIKEREIEENTTEMGMKKDIKDTRIKEKLAEVGMSDDIKESAIAANITDVRMDEDLIKRGLKENVMDVKINEHIKEREKEANIIEVDMERRIEESTTKVEMKKDVKEIEIEDNISTIRMNEHIKEKEMNENSQESGTTQFVDTGEEGNIIETGAIDISRATRMKVNIRENIDYNVDDSVIVRYYQNKWKYYIGFIEHITTKKNYEDKENTFYTIRFLKTIKKPTLKFIPTRKIDRDTVPEVNIVKRVELAFNTKVYTLKDCDCASETYFS